MKKLHKVMLLASVLSTLGVPSIYAAASLEETQPTRSPKNVVRTQATVKEAIGNAAASLGIEDDDAASSPPTPVAPASPLQVAPVVSETIAPAEPSVTETSVVAAAVLLASEPALTATPSQRRKFSWASLLCWKSKTSEEEPQVLQSRSLPSSIKVPAITIDSEEANTPHHPEGYANILPDGEGLVEDTPPSTPTAIDATPLEISLADTPLSTAPLPTITGASQDAPLDTEVSLAPPSEAGAPPKPIRTATSKNQPKGSRKSCWPLTKSSVATTQEEIKELWVDVKPVLKTGIALALNIGGDLLFSAATKDAFINFASAVEEALSVKSNGATIRLTTSQGTRMEMTSPALVYAKEVSQRFLFDEASAVLSVLLHKLAFCKDYRALITLIRMVATQHNPAASETLRFEDKSGALVLDGSSKETLYLYGLVKGRPQKEDIRTVLNDLTEALGKRTTAENKLQKFVPGNFLAPNAPTRTFYETLIQTRSPFILNSSLTSTGGVDPAALEELKTADTTA